MRAVKAWRKRRHRKKIQSKWDRCVRIARGKLFGLHTNWIARAICDKRADGSSFHLDIAYCLFRAERALLAEGVSD
jgi:hypothetical protein